MRACKHTHTHTLGEKYVIFIAFPRYQWLANAPPCYLTSTLPLLLWQHSVSNKSEYALKEHGCTMYESWRITWHTATFRFEGTRVQLFTEWKLGPVFPSCESECLSHPRPSHPGRGYSISWMDHGPADFQCPLRLLVIQSDKDFETCKLDRFQLASLWNPCTTRSSVESQDRNRLVSTNDPKRPFVRLIWSSKISHTSF